LAAALAYWQSLERAAQKDMALAREITDAGGSTNESLRLPYLVSQVLPESMRQRIARVSEVTLNAPSSELLAKVIALPYLSRLSIGGGEYDLNLISRLASKPLLSKVRISGRQLDAQAVAAIASLRQVQSLNLMRTNITAKALNALGEMPRLQSINLTHTDVVLAELGKPAFSKTVRNLRLPHPPAGQGGHLTLEGWPELRSLACNEYDELLNDKSVVLELKQLPKLQKISLDALQAFELHLEGLPELVQVEALHSQWAMRITPQEILSEAPFIRKLTIGATPKLESLRLYGPAVAAIEFREPMEMELKLDGGFMYESDHFQLSAVTNPPTITSTNWLSGLAGDVGPTKLVLQGLHLDKVDLAPLAKCLPLRSLDMSNCQVTAGQLALFKGMERLEELCLEGCQLDGQMLSQLAAGLPKLRKLICNPYYLQRLKLENHPQLENIVPDPDPPLLPIDALQLVAMPKLKDAFDLPRELWSLRIEDAPSLSGVSTRGPWPEKAVFKGVRDLTYFAGGGEHLSDAVAEAVLACEKLEKLTLAYSSVSPELLGKVSSLKNLKYLALCGSRVDDDVVAKWQPLPQLRALRLDDTAITDKSLEFILACAELEHLSLRNTAVTEQGLAKLAKLEKLSRIDCGGEDWTVAKMNAVCNLPSLTVLDLSNTTLTPQIVSALQQNPPPKLSRLILRNSQVQGQGLLQLARDHSDLGFDLTDTDIDANALAALGTSGRVSPPTIDENDTHRLMFGYISGRQSSNPNLNRAVDAKRDKGIIDPQVFNRATPLGPSDSLSPYDGPGVMTGPEAIVMVPPMSIPEMVGYAIGNFSKTFSSFAKQGDQDAVEY
ncbi:MAG: hypothetical protein ACTHK7_14790, partial [Aureliella sp.]